MPGSPKQPGRHPHDAAYKSLFASRRTVADTLRGALRDLAASLDFSTLERLPASFVTEHLRQRQADMLWRVQIAGGGWLYLLVLLEFQSTVDRRMALRMMDYTARVLQGLDRNDLGPGGEFPFVLPIVVYNGGRRWNATTDMRDLFPPAPEQLVGYVPRHRYLLIELQALDASVLPPENVLSMIARLEQARSLARLEELVESLVNWLERAGEPNLLHVFGAWIELVLEQRTGMAEGTPEPDFSREEQEKVTTLLERVRKWGEEERKQWLEEGVEQGRREGVEKGRIEGERDLVYRLVARRFGPDTAERLGPVLDPLSDPERIVAVADAVLECQTAEEFIARARKAAGTA